MCSCPKNAMKSKFVQGRCFAPAHLSRPTLGKLRGLVLKPSSSRNSVEHSRKRMRLNYGLNFYEKNAALIASLTRPIEQEASELIAIFTTIIRRTGAK